VARQLRYSALIPTAVLCHTHYNQFWKGQTMILPSYLTHKVILLLLRAVV